MAVIPVGISMEENDILLVDKVAKAQGRSRSSFISRAAVKEAKEVIDGVQA